MTAPTAEEEIEVRQRITNEEAYSRGTIDGAAAALAGYKFHEQAPYRYCGRVEAEYYQRGYGIGWNSIVAK